MSRNNTTNKRDGCNSSPHIARFLYTYIFCKYTYIISDLRNRIDDIIFYHLIIMENIEADKKETSDEPELDTKQEKKKEDIAEDSKADTNPDPVIIELLRWLEENLPDAKPEDIFKQVRRLQKVFDSIMTLPMEYFLAHTGITPKSEEYIDSIIHDKKEYISLTRERQLKLKKLEASTAKLDLKREQYKLVTSINLDDCMDRISRHNHLMSKK